MEMESASVNFVLSLLEGKWSGTGRGGYPTIDSFDFVETVTFERRNENSLFYIQRTEKRMDGQDEFVVSHWESGFIRGLMTEESELANVQIGGRAELLTGRIEIDGSRIRLDFKSSTIANDERMIASSRIIEIDGDTLQYEMKMSTTRNHELTRHLSATLKRIA